MESWLTQGKRFYRLKNYKMALDCYEKAIADGDAEAMYLVACMYKSGTGVAKSICKARAMLTQAADAGYKKAANVLPMLTSTSYGQRCFYVDEIFKLREKGKYQEAMEEFLYIVGKNEKPDDYTGECMYGIGMMYKLGEGVPKDEVIAEEWLRKAADNNSWNAVKELKLDRRIPEVICENNCAKATAYIRHNIRRRENPEIILLQLSGSFSSDIKIYIRGKCIDVKDWFSMFKVSPRWERGTKLDITAEGEDAEKAVDRIAGLFYNRFSKRYLENLILEGRINEEYVPLEKRTVKPFDEAEFLSKCMAKFPDIRKRYNLDEDTLQRAKQNPLFEPLAELIMKGYTEQGILELKKKLPAWESRRFSFMDIYPWEVCFSPNFFNHSNPTADAVNSMSSYYDEKCSGLRSEMESLQQFEDEIKRKEQLVATGDIKTIIALGKLYEKGGKWCKPDKGKARLYYQRLKDAWDNVWAKRYESWLDKAVQDSGLERLGNLGREYIDGTFAENAQKASDAKFQREVAWLNKAIKAGDGWAAFTKGNLCYYGYGWWKNRRKDAYNYYIKAAISQNAIRALELERINLERMQTTDYPVLREFLYVVQ
ncbi:HPr family phosphocarrier protein [Selenomonas sp. KH1T6]|uniref:HPr family phosphocarrier protein n=1 Tax=Selenomonas sp. KH1T6 TaxID=3158784 RepID=UPI0008A7D78A|nr:Sel1 repeat-containing protein [Selenomonas ruminantium]